MNEYDSLISLAKESNRSENYLKSGEFYEDAFELIKGTNHIYHDFEYSYGSDFIYIDFYNASCSWSLAQNKTKSIQYLDSAFVYGFYDLNHIEEDKDLDFIRDELKFNELIKKEKEFEADSIIDEFDFYEMLNGKKRILTFRNVKFDIEYGAHTKDLNFPTKSIQLIDVYGNLYIRNAKLYNLTVRNSGNKHLAKFYLDSVELEESSMEMENSVAIDFNNVEFGRVHNFKFKDISYLHMFNSNLNLTHGGFINGDYGYGLVSVNNKDSGNKIGIVDCHFTSLGSSIVFALYTDDLLVSGSTFELPIDFIDSKVNESFYLYSNDFIKPVDISVLKFPEENNFMPFQQFKSGFGISPLNHIVDQLKSYSDTDNDIFVGNYQEIRDSLKYKLLLNSYNWARNLYVEQGDLRSANESINKMQEIRLTRELFLYRETKSFNQLIRYQLGRLMKLYTDHGTNPSKAILISIYIILGFSVFYFFFPSEWDTTSKGKLISNFNDFRTKNEHGYFKPFLSLLWGFFVSLVNAFTLSLNAFVTLGFGTIPTRGLARYVCVIQGFIGWFLLSIFTVALINQVLA